MFINLTFARFEIVICANLSTVKSITTKEGTYGKEEGSIIRR
jgi:hypothetical protein